MSCCQVRAQISIIPHEASNGTLRHQAHLDVTISSPDRWDAGKVPCYFEGNAEEGMV